MKDILSSHETQSNISDSFLSPPLSPTLVMPSAVGAESSTKASKGKNKNSHTSPLPVESSSSNEVGSNMVTQTPSKGRKRKSSPDSLDILLAAALTDDISRPKDNDVVKRDTDQLFCESLVDLFQKLPLKKNKLARIKVLQVLYDRGGIIESFLSTIILYIYIYF